jgi:hypothetical protein
MENIRIDTGVKRVTINDGPEYLEFNPSDIIFAEKFYRLINEFENKKVEYLARAEEIDKNTEKDSNGIAKNIPEGLALMHEICNFTEERIDSLFGEGSSKKLFGEALSLNMFEQFFTGITPFIQTVRANKIGKYIPEPLPVPRRRHKKIATK